jgi:hypothetical protein
MSNKSNLIEHLTDIFGKETFIPLFRIKDREVYDIANLKYFLQIDNKYIILYNNHQKTITYTPISKCVNNDNKTKTVVKFKRGSKIYYNLEFNQVSEYDKNTNELDYDFYIRFFVGGHFQDNYKIPRIQDKIIIYQNTMKNSNFSTYDVKNMDSKICAIL